MPGSAGTTLKLSSWTEQANTEAQGLSSDASYLGSNVGPVAPSATNQVEGQQLLAIQNQANHDIIANLGPTEFQTSDPPSDTNSLSTATLGGNINVMLDTGTLDTAIQQQININSFVFPAKSTIGNLDSTQDPATIVVLDANNQIRYQTNKFLLTSLSKAHQERFQVIETFGDPSFLFFNARAKMYTLQGILMDSDYLFTGDTATGTTSQSSVDNLNDKKAARYQWAQAFQEFYTDNLRATMLKENNYVAALYVNNSIIKGYPLSLTMGKESTSMPDAVTFQMTWVIVNDLLLRSTASRYLYDQGKSLDSTFSQAFADWNAALTHYDNIKTALQNAPTLAAQASYQALLANAGKVITATMNALQVLIAQRTDPNGND